MNNYSRQVARAMAAKLTKELYRLREQQLLKASELRRKADLESMLRVLTR